MSAVDELNYFLFPHTMLSDNYLRDLCISLPRLTLLEIVRKAPVPEWAQGRVAGWPVLSPDDLLSTQISSCLQGYREFAQVHGGRGGILGYLSRVFDDLGESRYRIQEELRGKCPPDLNPGQKETMQAALFLEIARELDEKELEIVSGYVHLSEVEQEFRDILGIDESESGEADLTPSLAPDTSGLIYMLPKRIASWFRMFSLRPVEGLPVFVACLPQVIEETIEMIRAGCERDGEKFSAATYSLGFIPGAGDLGPKQYQTLIEAPEIPELLSSCHRELEDFIKSAAEGENPAELRGRSRSIQSALEKLCGECAVPAGDKVNLSLTLVENVFLTEISAFLGVPQGVEAKAWPPIFLSVEAGS
jgi:hypothetical protein